MLAQSALLAALATSVSAWTAPATLFDPLVASKVLATAKTVQNPPKIPSITSTSGTWTWSSANSWTSGFFPATLYQLSKRECMCSGSTSVNGSTPDWRGLGRTWSAALVPLHWHNGVGHDVGFLSWPFVDELALSPTNATAQSNIIDFALELTSRYSPIVKATRSWDSDANSTDFLVIVDNLMNLETLLQSWRLTGNRTFYDIAVNHADTTLKNGVRSDWSTWHVINYDSGTGAVKVKRTQQGYSDNSTWTRGEAWALHGYTRMYQYTKLKRYLDAARAIAGYYLRRVAENPSYMIWDFDAPASPQPPADSSAAMIAAGGLQALATIEMSLWNATGANTWMAGAQNLITQTATYAWNPSWQSLLSNGTRDNNAGGVPASRSNNTGLPYGDYFWIKNGNYLLETLQIKCPDGRFPNRLACGSDLMGPSF
ncbi:Six-hairpin glycosidase [Auriculariales sp. MPI-PUGE-AT-0066]|nr:Six-hairpin glycosidase [Auriculariales sp. MPI-PUGE-AT-0066]